jgi:hypothetical protein
MRESRSGILALVALFLWSPPALPAERVVPEEGAVRVALLRHKSIRDELKLTEDETKRIHDFTDRQWQKAQRIEALPAAERDREFAGLSRENDQFLKEVLEPEQLKRLNQITLQTAGLLWVTYPQVADQLRLTEEQKAKARQYQAEARREMQEILYAQTRGERHAKLKELRQTSRKRLMEILTDEQEKTWKEMCGEPFHGEMRFEPEPAGR